MKFVQTLLLSFVFLLGMQVSATANGPSAAENGIEPIAAESFTTNAAEAEYVKVMENDNKKGIGKFFSWVKKKVVKFAQKVAKIGGLGDPVDKWFWFWIIGWGAAILLSIIASVVLVGAAFSGGFGIGAVLYIFAYLAGLFGTVSLIVWLIKKFS